MDREIRALVVDDSSTTRSLIIRALQQTGLARFEFVEAKDGVEALERFQPGATELIFVDMNMPRMDGLEFVRELDKRHKKRPPVVMITAESNPEQLQKSANEAGIDAFLVKPVDRDRLRTGLQTIMDSIPERGGPSKVPHGDCVHQALKAILLETCQLKLDRMDTEDFTPRGTTVLGTMSIHGAVDWSVIIGFPRTAVPILATNFAGYDVPDDDAELGDAIGELTSMICGRTKSHLSDRGLTVSVSLPTVVSVSEFRILLRRKGTTDRAVFNTAFGPIWTIVTVGLHAGMVL